MKTYKALMVVKQLHEKIKFNSVKKKMTISQYLYELLRIEKSISEIGKMKDKGYR